MRIPLCVSAALLLVAALAAGCSKESAEPSAFILDSQGRALILRGTNVDNHAKHDELHAVDMPDEEIRLFARELGLNFVRYLVFWSGLEPEPGVHDEDYLDRIEADLDRFHQEGIYILLDMHQDVYSRRFCCDGAPEWAIRDNGEDFVEQASWFTNYFQPAVQAAFDNFWAYTDGDHADLQDHYFGTLQKLAKRFRDHPAVLGYDIMNEPHPGSEFDALEALDPTIESFSSRSFDEEKLHPFYQRAINAIREVDDDGWIFFEPRYGSPGNGGASYIPELSDPRKGNPRLVYAPHLYSVTLEATGRYDAESDRTIELWEEQRKEDLERQPMPIVLGEWGLTYGTENAEAFVNELAELSERMLLSWAHWSWDPGGPTSWALYDREAKAPNPLFHAVERPYPRATAGEPISLSFDEERRTLEYRWRARDGAKGETEIYFPPARDEGSEAFEVDLGEGASYRWDEAIPGLLLITKVPAEDEHRLIIRPKI